MNVKWFSFWSKTAKSYYAAACQYNGTDGKGRSINGKTLYLHRCLMDAKKHEYVDHIDHDTLNNKRYNLRLASNSNNNKHRGKINTNNTSGYRNVCWVSSKEQWRVQLQINGKCVRFGDFDDVDEAGTLAEEMRKKYYKEYAGVS